MKKVKIDLTDLRSKYESAYLAYVPKRIKERGGNLSFKEWAKKEMSLDLECTNVKDALVALTEAGADIKQIGENSFLVRDNGFHGFCEETDPFIIDGEDLLEMWEQYIGE
jgi:hypothetical protein